MEILLACEESQAVTIRMREKGHEAYSCDILPCSGGHPEWHLQQDVMEAVYSRYWDFIGLHIPCTAMAVSGNRWYGKNMPKHSERIKAIKWSLKVWSAVKNQSNRAYMENPVSVLFSHITDMVQYIHPWQFGHGETKKTGLALYNLPKLEPTSVVSGREKKIWKMPPSKNRAKLRSKTYEGIAQAMADQWGELSYNSSYETTQSEIASSKSGKPDFS